MHLASDENEPLSLFLAHRSALISYANRIVGDVARAEDVVQEAWVRLDTAMKGQRPDEPSAYLYRIVHNLAIDSYRRRAREENVMAPEGAFEGRAHAGDTPSPEAVVRSREELSLLAAAMAELPERTRTALEMSRFDGCKLREIAEHLGISVTAAHVLVAQGLAHCRMRLKRG